MSDCAEVVVVRVPQRVIVARETNRATVVHDTKRVVAGRCAAQLTVVQAIRRVVVRGTGAQGPPGVSARYTAPADGDLVAGDFCYVTAATLIAAAVAGVSSATQCTGFVLADSLDGAPATIVFGGLNDALSGLTPGARYYLSATVPGAAGGVPVASGTGLFHQYLGRAVTATTLAFEGDDMIRLRAA